MIYRVGALLALPLAATFAAMTMPRPAAAAELPAIKISEANKVPACATPGRLMAFTEQRNGKLDGKFAAIAADYMRIGEQLAIRWDTAYFQMLLETGNLTFTGDVSITQNNFAGLGATGKHEPGESFADVPTGVKAHLEHLLLYAGEKLDNPVAERTRKVQEWGVLTEWQKTIKGPMTFTQLARKWAPTSRSYVSEIQNVSEAFYGGLCKGPDPKPEMMALVHPESAKKKVAAGHGKGAAKTVPAAEAKTDITDTTQDVAEADAATSGAPRYSGAELARKAVEEARVSGSYVRSSLGGASLAKAADAAEPSAKAAPVHGPTDAAKASPAVTIINAPKPDAPVAAAAQPGAVEPQAKVEKVALNTGGKAQATPTVAVAEPHVSKCRVWTASYGGGRAVIIKASAEQLTNYTVLDVNEGSERREAEAYIAAYARGGQTIGEFQSETQALDKAFELCPEG